jgi:hypothetical protein
VIVVAGDLRSGGAGAGVVAGRVAGLGERVEAVGILPADATGDRRLLELRAAGVGHAAVLRSPAEALDAADLDLALRYLPDIGAIVLVEPGVGLVATAAAAASWLGAGLIVVASQVVELSADGPGPDRTVVLAPPRSDPDGAFAGFVAALAVRLAGGATPADAWSGATSSLGVEKIGDGVSEEPLP